MNTKTIPLTLLMATALAVVFNLAVGLPTEAPASATIIIGLIAIMVLSFAAGAYWGLFQGRDNGTKAQATREGFSNGLRYAQEMEHYNG